ncbi:hypothetical protein I3842_03G174800 [Carya illinoinensis]|uniref:Uncharacterized protein n=1 Tax=Carya illinoinensis TaxID=32201 RepID=A0A922FNE1_CARIL|nr:hypothetical protein I3842_03G174800 [Carya illinoinensis]
MPICSQLANHRFTTKTQRRIYGHTIDAEIHPLNEENAVQAAADIVKELFVFTVVGAAVFFLRCKEVLDLRQERRNCAGRNCRQ